jgi:hypothetical protein
LDRQDESMLVILKERSFNDQWQFYQELLKTEGKLLFVVEESRAAVRKLTEDSGMNLNEISPDDEELRRSLSEDALHRWEREVRLYEGELTNWEKQKTELELGLSQELLEWEQKKEDIEAFNQDRLLHWTEMKNQMVAAAMQTWNQAKAEVAAINRHRRKQWEVEVRQVMNNRWEIDNRYQMKLWYTGISWIILSILLYGGITLKIGSWDSNSLLLPAGWWNSVLIALVGAWILTVVLFLAFVLNQKSKSSEEPALPPEPAYEPQPAQPSTDDYFAMPMLQELPPRPQLENLPPRPVMPAFPKMALVNKYAPPPNPPAIDLVERWKNLMLENRFPDWNDPLPSEEKKRSNYQFARYLTRELNDDFILMSDVWLDKEFPIDHIVLGPTGIWIYLIIDWDGIVAWGEKGREWEHWERTQNGFQQKDTGLSPGEQWKKAAGLVKSHLQIRMPWLLRDVPALGLIHGGLVFTNEDAEYRVDPICPTPFLRMVDGKVNYKLPGTIPDGRFSVDRFDESKMISVASTLQEKDWKVMGMPLHHTVDLDHEAEQLRKDAEAAIYEWQTSLASWQTNLISWFHALAGVTSVES